MPLSAYELADLRTLVTDPSIGFLSDTAILEPNGGGSDGRGGVVHSDSTADPIPCRYQGDVSTRGLQIIATRPANKLHAELSLPWNAAIKPDMQIQVTRNDFSPPLTNLYTIIDIIGNTEQPLFHVVVELIQ